MLQAYESLIFSSAPNGNPGTAAAITLALASTANVSEEAIAALCG